MYPSIFPNGTSCGQRNFFYSQYNSIGVSLQFLLIGTKNINPSSNSSAAHKGKIGQPNRALYSALFGCPIFPLWAAEELDEGLMDRAQELWRKAPRGLHISRKGPEFCRKGPPGPRAFQEGPSRARASQNYLSY